MKATGVWVTVSAKHTGNVADDDGAKLTHWVMRIPHSFELAYSLFLNPMDNFAWNGRASEFVGTVMPSDLKPQEDYSSYIRLNRDVLNWRFWSGPNGDGTDSVTVGQTANDFSFSADRDDDPQSGESNGKIYDNDAPGTDSTFLASGAQNWVKRYRVNFHAWAELSITQGTWSHCSPLHPWYTRQSYKKTGPATAGISEAATTNTLTDLNTNWNANEWAPGAVLITAGPARGDVRYVTGNTATTVTVETNFSVNPGPGAGYILVKRSTWSLLNDIPGDNTNADGTTTLSWNLQ